MRRSVVVKVVKDKGLLGQALALLILALLITMIPSLIALLALLIAYRVIKALRLRRKNVGFKALKLKNRWPIFTGRIKSNELRKVGSLGGCGLYVPEGGSTCLLCLNGFTLTGSGYLSLKPLEPFSIDVKPLMHAALKMRRQLVVAFIVDPGRYGPLKVKVATLVVVRAVRRCLTVDESQVESLVNEVERCLDGVRAVLMSQPYHLELDVLSGDDLINANLLLVGGYA